MITGTLYIVPRNVGSQPTQGVQKMDSIERDNIEKINSIALDVQTIKANQINLNETIKSFTNLYTTIDTRVRNLEMTGHECKNTQLIQQFMQFMIESKGVQKAQRPVWDSIRNGITSIVVGIVMLCLGFMAGGGK
jgi:hypothetical protein